MPFKVTLMSYTPLISLGHTWQGLKLIFNTFIYSARITK